MWFDQGPIHKYILLVEIYLSFSLFTCFHIGSCFDKNTLEKSFPLGQNWFSIGVIFTKFCYLYEFFPDRWRLKSKELTNRQLDERLIKR